LWRCICDCGNEKIANTGNLRCGHILSCGCGKLQILIGKRFGRLTVIERAESIKKNVPRWRCRCDCGTEITTTGELLRSGHTRSCGCIKSENLIGKRFGKLTVIGRAENLHYSQRSWRCKCDCGNETIVVGYSLRRGDSKSCGCTIKKGYGEASFNALLLKYKRHAEEYGREFLLTDDEFRELIFSNCYYCGKAPLQVMHNKYSNGDIIDNGIDRIDRLKGYFQGNVRPCCRQCNFIKNKYSEEEFLSMVKAIYEHLNLDTRISDRIN
jgi:hypothetical protein